MKKFYFIFIGVSIVMMLLLLVGVNIICNHIATISNKYKIGEKVITVNGDTGYINNAFVGEYQVYTKRHGIMILTEPNIRKYNIGDTIK